MDKIYSILQPVLTIIINVRHKNLTKVDNMKQHIKKMVMFSEVSGHMYDNADGMM